VHVSKVLHFLLTLNHTFFLTECNEEIYKLTKLDHFSEVEKMHFPIGHPSDLTMQLMVLATECVNPGLRQSGGNK